MPEFSVNTVQTVPIDATGEVATYEISSTWASAKTVGLNIDADEAIDVSVDIGGENASDGTKTWFTDEVTYLSTDTIRDSWVQAEEWLRIRITTAASDGSEATVYIARGD